MAGKNKVGNATELQRQATTILSNKFHYNRLVLSPVKGLNVGAASSATSSFKVFTYFSACMLLNYCWFDKTLNKLIRMAV